MMKVFVTGGTGYVGKVVVDWLCEAGHDVTTLQRAGSARAFQQRGVNVAVGDVLDPSALPTAMRHHDAVIHLVGIIREHPRLGITMKRVHVEGTANVLHAAQQSGIHRFLHMSALNTRQNAVSNYHKSKWIAEDLVRQSGMSYTIFRPSVIFGKGGPGPEFVGQLLELVKKAPVVPVIGHGQFLLQPVAVQTVAAVFTESLQNMNTCNRTYEVGGPSILSYLDILQEIANALKKPLRAIRVPVFLMKKLVPVLQNTPGFPITKDQLTMLLEGNVCTDTDPVYHDLHVEKIPFRVTL